MFLIPRRELFIDDSDHNLSRCPSESYQYNLARAYRRSGCRSYCWHPARPAGRCSRARFGRIFGVGAGCYVAVIRAGGSCPRQSAVRSPVVPRFPGSSVLFVPTRRLRSPRHHGTGRGGAGRGGCRSDVTLSARLRLLAGVTAHPESINTTKWLLTRLSRLLHKQLPARLPGREAADAGRRGPANGAAPAQPSDRGGARRNSPGGGEERGGTTDQPGASRSLD